MTGVGADELGVEAVVTEELLEKSLKEMLLLLLLAVSLTIIEGELSWMLLLRKEWWL